MCIPTLDKIGGQAPGQPAHDSLPTQCPSGLARLAWPGHRWRGRPLRVALFLTAGGAGLVQGQATESVEEEILTLNPFIVNTTEDFGYRATSAITATRIGVPIADTPISVHVITDEFLKDLAAQNYTQVFNYTPGVAKNSTDDWEAINSLRIRGFRPDFIYRNTFRQYRAFYHDGIDRIEVVKGPATVFFGKVEPGGLVNYSIKRPQGLFATSATATIGDNQEYKATLDHQGVLDDNRLAYRVVGSTREAESWRENCESRDTYLLGALQWRPWRALSLNLDAESYQRELQGAGGYGIIANLDYLAFLDANRSLTLPDGTSTAHPTLDEYRQWVFRTTGVAPSVFTGFWFPRGASFNRQGAGTLNELDGHNATLEAVLRLGENLHLRTAYNYSRDEETTNVFFNADPHQSPVAFPYPRGTAGNYTSINYGFLIGPKFVADDALWWDMPGARDMENEIQTVQADLVWDFELLSARHTLTGSWEMIYDEFLSFNYLPNLAAFRADGGTPFDSWADADDMLGGYFVDLRSDDPVPDYRRWLGPRKTESGDGARRYDYGYGLSYYGRWLGERLHVLGGVRRVTARSIAYRRTADGVLESVPVPGIGWAERSGTVPMVGLVYQAAPGFHLYANYSESFEPNTRGQIGANFVYNHDYTANPAYTGPAQVGGDTLDNETGLGLEGGVKFALLGDKLNGTLSAFRVEKDNIEQRDAALERDLNDAGFVRTGGGQVTLYRNSGLQRTEGLEFEIIYQPSRNYQILGSFTYLWEHAVVEPDPSLVHVSRGGTWDPDFDPATPGNQNDGSDRDWREIVNTPDQQFALWQKYTFTEGVLQGLSLGLGVTFRSESPADQNRHDFGFVNESFWLVEGLVGYEREVGGRPMTLALNVGNLLDEEYVNGQQGGYGDPRNWRLTLGYKF